MKTITALTTASATLATTLITGAIFFAPQASTASTASFGPNTKSSQVAVYVTDDEGDGIENVKVLVSDANNPTAKAVETASGADGHLEVPFPRGGTYIVHIDTPPDPTQYNEGNDTDVGATYRCGSKVLSRCITVQVADGVVHFPGQTSAVPAKQLDMWFEDRTPEPRIEVVVELKDHPKTLIAGGKISIAPETDDPNTNLDDPFSMDGKGRTRSKTIASTRYDITFTPPTGYSLVDPKHGTQNEHVTRLTTVRYVVVADPTSDAENSGVHIEPDQQPGSVGGQRTTHVEDDALDVVIDILGGNDSSSRKDPVEQTSTDDDPSDSNPLETTVPTPAPNNPPSDDSPTIVGAPPADTVPADTVPVETVPSTEVPATNGPTAECFNLLEMYRTVTEIDPGLYGACEVSPADAITIINELLAELGF